MATKETEKSPEQTCADLSESLSTICAAQLDRTQHNMEATLGEIQDIQQIVNEIKNAVAPFEVVSLNQAIQVACQVLDALLASPKSLSTDILLSLNELGDIAFQFVTCPPEEQLQNLYSQCFTLQENFKQYSNNIVAECAKIPSEPIGNTTELVNNETQTSLSPTASEIAAFQKYQPRADDFFVALFSAGIHATATDVAESSTYDNLARVAEIIFVRATPQGSIILFAAELPDSVLTDIAGHPITAVTKDNPLSTLIAPWNTIAFHTTETAQAPQAPQTTQTTQAPQTPQAPQATKQAAQVPQAAQATPQTPQQPSQPQHAPQKEPVDEDFDTQNLSLPSDLSTVDPEMLQDFLANADELLEKLSECVLDLENDPTSKDAIEQIFRAAHTIKGTAGMFGFRAIQKLTHVMENLFDLVRKGQLLATPSHIDAVLFGFDRVRSMFDLLRKNALPEVPINDALAQLNASLRGDAPPTATSTSHTVTASTPTASTPTASTPTASTPTASTPTAVTATTSQAATSKSSAAAPAKKDDGSGTLRVDLKRLDSLVNLVGELVIDRTRFALIEDEIRARGQNSELLHSMSEAVLLFGRHMNEVQSIIMKIRMVPVGNAFTKFSRMVRDLAKDCGKEVDLHIEGGEAELDKTLVEEIGDPLVHLIRNSVDHGIETPDEREKSGKPRRGNILLRARQDSNMIVITIQDDGRGLQVDKLRKKALQNGLIKENEVLTDKETYNLIFEAGFSTAEKVTNISGRGVGMDVVKKNITKLKGVIELDSGIGEGTTTTIKLPLTLAIIPSLMIEVQNENYAIPLVNVVESLRISPNEIQRVGAVDFVKLREKAMPLLYMSKMFGIEDSSTHSGYRTEGDKNPHHSQTSGEHSPTLEVSASNRRNKKPRIIFVVVGIGEKRVGVVVDQLLGQQEIVIKSLGKILPKPQGIAGGCVLGNGKVALVLDVGEIVEEMGRGRVKGVYHE